VLASIQASQPRFESCSGRRLACCRWQKIRIKPHDCTGDPVKPEISRIRAASPAGLGLKQRTGITAASGKALRLSVATAAFIDGGASACRGGCDIESLAQNL